jgi:hypothetical protein
MDAHLLQNLMNLLNRFSKFKRALKPKLEALS